jgi:hypothetical protein
MSTTIDTSVLEDGLDRPDTQRGVLTVAERIAHHIVWRYGTRPLLPGLYHGENVWRSGGDNRLTDQTNGS